MNFDRLNPLSSYLFSSSNNSNTTSNTNITKNKLKENFPKPVDFDSQLASEISDWGIENSTQPNSRTNTSINGLLSSPSITSTSASVTNNEDHHVELNYNHLHEDLFSLPPPHPSFLPRQSRNSHYPHHQQHQHQHQQQRRFSNTSANSQISNQDFQYYYDAYVPDHISPDTHNLSKFICKYISLEHKLPEFWEKLKYNLIVSNLLEDSMVLSKNDSNLQTLSTTIHSGSHKKSDIFSFSFNDDGTKLYILDKEYKLYYNLKYNNMKIIILVINMIIFLLKQQQMYYNQTPNYLPLHLQLKMFKTIVYMSMKIIKVRKFKIIITSSRILQILQQFLILNYKINKRLITKFNNLKAQQLNLVFNKQQRSLSNHLLNSLEFLNLNLQSSIVKLLPYMNGNLFEQYCTVNNVTLDISEKDRDVSYDDDKNNLQLITTQINKFDNLRKLFICQLLTINEPSNLNFFVYKLMDDFGVEEEDQQQRTRGISDISRMQLIYDILFDHNSTLTSIDGLFEKFEEFNKSSTCGDVEDKNSKDSSLISQSNLEILIVKMSNLTTNLKYFQKYNHSIENLDNADEQQEKLMIFNQFKEELDHIKTLYKSSSFELNRDLNPSYIVPQSPSAISNVSASPTTGSQAFNLKSFHNSSLKKRFSLPPPQSLPTPTTPTTPTNIINNNHNNNNNNNNKENKYKRLSTGLQLGLLTVFEKEQPSKETSNRNSTNSLNSGSSSSANKNIMSYDDNYINILPPSSYETYNQKSLEALNKRMRNSVGNNNRYSLNSVQSNVSGITDLISTNLTSYGEQEDEDDDETDQRHDGNNFHANSQNPLSKEDLKLKLEESFNRIYNLENENKLLKENLSGSINENNAPNVEDDQDLANVTKPNPRFLSELELKLSK